MVGERSLDIVFVPAWVSNIEMFWENLSLAHLFARLGSFSRLILVERRGSGMSDGFAGVTPLEEQVDDRHALFHLARDRHEDHAKSLLADTEAIVTSDRWWAYAHLPLARRQICCSHLRRDFQAHAEGLGAEKEFGEAGLHLCERVFWAWEVFAHTHDRRELKRTIRSLQREYKPIIRGYARKRARNRRCRGMARNLIKLWPALSTFASHEGVQPTNNHAERALRGAVIYRKLSLGNQSKDGEQRIGRLLSAHTTCRLQRRSLHTYTSELLAAHPRGDPRPIAPLPQTRRPLLGGSERLRRLRDESPPRAGLERTDRVNSPSNRTVTLSLTVRSATNWAFSSSDGLRRIGETMLSLLFVLGLLVGIGGAVIAVASVLLAVVTVLAWLNVFVAILGARIKQRAGRDQAPALTTAAG